MGEFVMHSGEEGNKNIFSDQSHKDSIETGIRTAINEK
jgi:hypothetical protein